VLNLKARTPNRRRLRVVAFVVLACVAGLVLWKQWPRGDLRFVGEWTMAAGDGQPFGKLILRRNGTGSLFQNSDSSIEESVVWRIEQECLIFGYPPSWLTDSVNLYWRWIAPGSLPLFPHDNPYPIVALGMEEIRVRNMWGNVTLRRRH